MAIKIPSKNIYKIENPKIIDNKIDRIEVNSVSIVPNNEYKVVVFGKDYESGWTTSSELSNVGQGQSNTSTSGGTQYYYYRAVAHYSLIPQYLSVSLSVPKLKDMSYINKIYYGYDIDENDSNKKIPQVKVTVHASKKQGTATATGNYNFTTSTSSISSLTKNYESTETSYSGQLSPSLTYKYEYPIYVGNGSINVALEGLDETILSPEYTENNDYYSLSFKCLVGYEQVQIGGSINGVAQVPPTTGTVSMTGTAIKYIPQKVEININGDTIGVDISDETIYIPSASGNKPFRVDRNELLQTSSYMEDTGANTITTMFDRIYQRYKNGKETATLLCDINDYYNEDGSISISKSGIVKVFKIGDIVLPMVFSANGQDRPMSTYKDGTPKYFKVVGTRVFFDGAVWQELTLQEYIA